MERAVTQPHLPLEGFWFGLFAPNPPESWNLGLGVEDPFYMGVGMDACVVLSAHAGCGLHNIYISSFRRKLLFWLWLTSNNVSTQASREFDAM